jgi:Tol biopolymer transport system component
MPSLRRVAHLWHNGAMLSERERLLKGHPRGIVWPYDTYPTLDSPEVDDVTSAPYTDAEVPHTLEMVDDTSPPGGEASPFTLFVGASIGLAIGLFVLLGALLFRPAAASLTPTSLPQILAPTGAPTRVVAFDPQAFPTPPPAPTFDWPTLVPTPTPRPTYTPWPTYTPPGEASGGGSSSQGGSGAGSGTGGDTGGGTGGTSGGGPTPPFGKTPQPVFTLGVIYPQTPGVVGTPAPTSITLPPDPILFTRNTRIFAIGSDGSGVVQLTNGPRRDLHPTWSPERRRAAFYSDRDGNPEIYTLALGDLTATRLTADPAADTDPAWDWTSDRIAFVSTRSGGGDIYTMNANGGSIAQVTSGSADDRHPAWAPAGGRIAFASNRDGGDFDLFVVNADGSGLTQLTTNTVDDTFPAWSPDGGRIAYVSAGDVYILNLVTKEITRLTALGTVSGPSWSPDGGRIVFSAGGDLWIIDVASQATTHLTADAAQDTDPAWVR